MSFKIFNRMITKTTTYDELDELMEKFRKRNIVAGVYMPSRSDIDNIIKPNFEKYADFVYWLLETSEPETENDKANKRYLMSLFNEKIKIEEDLDTVLFLKFDEQKYEAFIRSIQNGNNLR